MDIMKSIKATDITVIQDTYAEKVSEIKAKLDSVKDKKWKLRYKKWFFIGIVIILLTIINSFELISPDNAIALTSLSTVLLIIYFFIG